MVREEGGGGEGGGGGERSEKGREGRQNTYTHAVLFASTYI